MIHTGWFLLLVLKHDLSVILHVNSIKKVSEFPKGLFFLTGPPPEMSLDWPPVNLLGLAPLNFLSVGIMLRSEHLNFFDHGGEWGAVYFYLPADTKQIQGRPS